VLHLVRNSGQHVHHNTLLLLGHACGPASVAAGTKLVMFTPSELSALPQLRPCSNLFYQLNGGAKFTVFPQQIDYAKEFIANTAVNYGYSRESSLIRTYAINSHTLRLVNEVRNIRHGGTAMWVFTLLIR
jgi:hypothetical protein